MNKIKWMQKCATANFQNWLVTPKIWIVFGAMAVFCIWNTSGIVEYSREAGIRVAPWIFPHFFSMPVMYFVYGFLTIALFSDAPFRNSLSQFIEIRTGKRLWIQGQCLFIIEASFCYALAYLLLTIVVILPRIYCTGQWGTLIKMMAYNSGTYSVRGIIFSSRMIERYSPIQAMLLTFLFVWMVSCFMGMLILVCRIIIGGNAGNVVTGFLVFFSYFAVYTGSLIFGGSIFKFSPVSWIHLDILGSNMGGYPDKWYAFSFLVIGTIAASIIGIKTYEIRDMD